VSLSSLTIWTAGPSDGPAALYPFLARIAVDIGFASSVSGCQLLEDPISGQPGFSSRRLVCGAQGSRIALSFPGAARADRLPSGVGIKVCTTRPSLLSAQLNLQLQVE
jgi:hypothetical protein